MHYKLLTDPSKYLQPADFPKPREVTIARLSREDLPTRDGEAKTSAPMLYIQDRTGAEYPRPYKVPKSVLYGLSVQFGTETDKWIGQKVTLFSARCMSFGEVEECIRCAFPADVEGKVSKWLRKRKVNPNAYIIKETEAK